MSKHISSSLHAVCHIMHSDLDQPMVMEVMAGFNYKEELTICINFIDSDEPAYDCSTAAIVNSDDARAMATRHKVRYTLLPFFIASCMEEWNEIVNASFNDTIACFKEITECLLDEGCRFRIERTYGPHGHQCC